MDRGENNNKYLKLSSFVCFGQSIEQQKPLNIGLLPQRERIIFQSSILRGLLLVSGRASQQASKQTNKTNKQTKQKRKSHKTFDKVRIIIILLAVSYQTYQQFTSGFSNPPSQNKILHKLLVNNGPGVFFLWGIREHHSMDLTPSNGQHQG